MLEVGHTLGPWRIESVSTEKMRALANVLRDPNPIHIDPAAVARLGLGNRVINQGPANLAYIVNMLTESVPHCRLLQFDARLLANVFGGDAVEAGGRVTDLQREATGTRIGCEVWLKVNGRGVAVAGNAVLYVDSSAVARSEQ